MIDITDTELIMALRQRFEQQRELKHDIERLTESFETLNERLVRSEAVKSLFLSNIRNEMINPITSILTLSHNMLDMENKDAGTCKNIARLIYGECFLLDRELHTLIAAAELEAGQLKPWISQIQVDLFIQNLLYKFDHLITEKKLKVDYLSDLNAGSEGDYAFTSDSEKMGLILSHLLSNAIEYSPKGGRVDIHAWSEAEYLNISVKDHGKGISKDDQLRIFDRFNQLETGSAKQHKGLGLGLSVTKELVNFLNGMISVTSETGKGSTFTIALPPLQAEKEDITTSDGGAVFFE